MKRLPILICTILLATTALVAPGCKPPRQAPPPPPKEKPVPEPVAPDLVAAAFSSLDGLFPTTLREAMQEEASTQGFALLTVSADSDAARQRQQIRDFIARRVEAIAVQPCGPTAIGEAIREANVAGIPVFTFHVECRSPGAEIVSHIGADEIQGGRLAGEAVIEAIGESGGEIILIDSRLGDSCLENIRGFRETIGKFNASRPTGEERLHIAAEIPGNGTREGGFRATADALPVHPHIIGIFAASDTAGLGAADALERAGRQDQVAVVALGNSQEAYRAIRDGKIYAAATLSPRKIGSLTIRSIAEYLDGKEIPTRQASPFTLYRKADAGKDPDLK